jgi:hypothetical protein
MTTIELLASLRELDIKLWVEGDRLRYSAAPGALTPSLRASLTERKAEIVQFLQGARAPVSRAPAIEPVSRREALPLSFAQQRLWFLDQLEPGGYAYSIAPQFRLKGNLDVRALELSLGEILRRHEALRTTFTSDQGRPVQRIAAFAPISIPLVDLGSMQEGERRDAADRLAAEERRIPFDLSTGPLIRGTLIRFSGLDHLFLLTLHHIAADGWSMGVLVRELEQAYRGYATGSAAQLEPIELKYADYAAWQREWMQ